MFQNLEKLQFTIFDSGTPHAVQDIVGTPQFFQIKCSAKMNGKIKLLED